MVLAKKKAVGAEYDVYNGQYSVPLVKKRKVIRKRHRTSLAHKVVAGFLSIACLFLIGLAYTSLKAGKARLNWELNQIKQENIAIAENMEKIKLEIAALKSPQRIEQIAVTQLGMIKNPQIEYLVINSVFGKKEESTAQNKEQSETRNIEKPIPAETEGDNNSIFRKMSTLLAH